MGSSAKVLLCGATSLIVGVYAISLKNVQTTSMQTAQSKVNRMQSERVVDAALVIALNYLKNTNGNTAVDKAQASIMGADVVYSIILPSRPDDIGDKATINLTVTKNGFSKSVVANVEKISQSKGQGKDKQKKGIRKLHRGTWQLNNTFVQRGQQKDHED
jgi:predicted solute-binding protein